MPTPVPKPKVIEITTEPEKYSLEHRPGKFVVPDDKTLQIDIDGSHKLAEFWSHYEKVRRNLEEHLQYVVEPPVVKSSKTPQHYHATVRLSQSLSAEDRIVLQCCLASDPTRELLSWCRVKLGMPDPILLAVTE